MLDFQSLQLFRCCSAGHGQKPEAFEFNKGLGLQLDALTFSLVSCSLAASSGASWHQRQQGGGYLFVTYDPCLTAISLNCTIVWDLQASSLGCTHQNGKRKTARHGLWNRPRESEKTRRAQRVFVPTTCFTSFERLSLQSGQLYRPHLLGFCDQTAYDVSSFTPTCFQI